MEAGLLFFQARRTSACQRILTRAAGYFSIEVPDVYTCVQKSDLNNSIARILKKRTIIFLVSSAPGPRPECAGAIFNTLHVPPDETGEPKGILRLYGDSKVGYLVESVDQAIVLFPDDPYEILKMAPKTFAQLKKKFHLPGSFPPKKHPDYQKLFADAAQAIRED